MPRRNDEALGAGSDSTSFFLTSSRDSSGERGKNLRMMSIVWSRNAVCWSQFTVDALNGGAYPMRTLPLIGVGECGRSPASASASNASCVAK